MATHDDGPANGDQAVAELSHLTRNGNEISYVAETGCRTAPDGSECRVHLGYSAEGFHTVVETMRLGNWSEPHASIQAATEAAWTKVFESSTKEQNNMAEIPAHVKAEADKAMANVNKAEITITDVGPAINERADPYDTRAMEAQREQQRQSELDKRMPEVNKE
jgi:hypothetical protein